MFQIFLEKTRGKKSNFFFLDGNVTFGKIDWKYRGRNSRKGTKSSLSSFDTLDRSTEISQDCCYK